MYCSVFKALFWSMLLIERHKKSVIVLPRLTFFIFQYLNCKMHISLLKESFEFSLCNIQTFHREKNTSINLFFFYKEYMQQIFRVQLCFFCVIKTMSLHQKRVFFKNNEILLISTVRMSFISGS